MSTQPAVLLASTSPYRAERLATLGLSFDTASPQVDETPGSREQPRDLAARLASAKARAIAASNPHCLIIGSDQTGESPSGDLLSKPVTPDRAVAQLQQCSGRTVTFHTAVALAGVTDQAWTVETKVRFRSLTIDEMQRYVEREAPLDCAGSFKMEALGITLFEWIRGDDPNALIGLPLISLAHRLRALGYRLP